MPHSPVTNIVLLIVLLMGCTPRPQDTTSSPAPVKHKLFELLRPEYQSIGDSLDFTWEEEYIKFGDLCTWESKIPVFANQNNLDPIAIDSTLKAILKATRDDFEQVCLGIFDPGTPSGEGNFSVEAGRIDNHLISLTHTSTVIYPGGKNHPITRSLQYSPSSAKFLSLPELFSIQPDSLYPLLRRLVLEEIEASQLLDNAEKKLFDDGAQTTEEVLSAAILTENGLIFTFGPGQSTQLSWSGDFQVLLWWETELK